MSNTILVKQDGRVAILTMNRPEKLNALSAELRRTLYHKVVELDQDDGIGAIILTGAGDRAFTAGMDLTEATERGTEAKDPDEHPVAVMETCSKPIIAAVNGLCITGGMEFVLACDVIIASRTAKFADTHVRVGLMPGNSISQRLSRQIGIQRAKEMSLSGNFYGAQQMYDWGLINHVVEPGELMPAALTLARAFADAEQNIVRDYKKLIDDGFEMTLSDARELERERSAKFHANVPADHYQRGKEKAARRARQQNA